MNITLEAKEKRTEHKVGDVVQGESGTFYMIIKDGYDNYRLLELEGGNVREDRCSSIRSLLNSFCLKDTHILKENVQMNLKEI
ncbi:hypothetical protein CON64_18610 [Bacillus pseudomycoides]|nr:hypothetical protein CON64_18610 [Bacillus pseudomycoides]